MPLDPSRPDAPSRPPRPAVLVTCRIPSSVMERLSSRCEVDVYRGPGAIPADELVARVAGKAALVCLLTDAVDRRVLEAGADLRVVANIAVGFDNIDVAEARARGIVVTNTPDVLTPSVADFTWGLILGITRRIVEGDRLTRRGVWSGWGLDFMLGSELAGKQLGIVGFGKIGRAVAVRAPAFGVRVARAFREVAGRPRPRPAMVQIGRSAIEVTPMSLDELLVTSDIVSLHVPLTDATRHLIGRAELARMKRSAYLVNTSRGPVVDEEALAWALGERLIAGAALDVYEREPAIHAGLLEHEHVVLAPHLGSATTETRTAMADLAARNVLAVLEGRAPLTAVSP